MPFSLYAPESGNCFNVILFASLNPQTRHIRTFSRQIRRDSRPMQPVGSLFGLSLPTWYHAFGSRCAFRTPARWQSRPSVAFSTCIRYADKESTYPMILHLLTQFTQQENLMTPGSKGQNGHACMHVSDFLTIGQAEPVRCPLAVECAPVQARRPLSGLSLKTRRTEPFCA